MIRIEKPQTPPEKLKTDGKQKRKSHAAAYTRDPAAYQTGTKKFEFSSQIYGHPTVKAALLKAQHQKCCFCEHLIGADGDVEHFRPKQAYRQAAGEALQHPGYYWLAYEWSNLYLACPACNQRHKQNLFPLRDPTQRATHHSLTIKQEQPLFLDPGFDNPEDFIAFRGEVPFAIDDNPRGKATITSLKLDRRSGLSEDRRQHLQPLHLLWQLIGLAQQQPKNADLQQLAKEAEQALDQAAQNYSVYAAVVRCAIATEFRYVIG